MSSVYSSTSIMSTTAQVKNIAVRFKCRMLRAAIRIDTSDAFLADSLVRHKFMLLCMVDTQTKRTQAQGYCSAAPTLWNRLPETHHKAEDIVSLKWQLKSHLFSTLVTHWPPYSLSCIPFLSPLSAFHFPQSLPCIPFLSHISASLFSQSPPCLPFLTVPSLHPFSHSPLPASLFPVPYLHPFFSQSPSCIPFSIIFTKHNEHVAVYTVISHIILLKSSHGSISARIKEDRLKSCVLESVLIVTAQLFHLL